jgi:O-antigen/teichoic acid export membrane protein
MGLIARQSFKAGTVTYLAAIVGLFNSTYIYPKMLSIGQLGEIQYIFSTASLMGSVLLLGLSGVLVKFFEQVKESEYRKQLLYGLVFGGTLINVFLFLLFSYLFKDQIMQYFDDNHGFSHATLFASICVSAVYPFVMLSLVFSSNKGRIAVPNLLLHLLKIVLPTLVTFYYFDFFTFTTLIRLLVAYYGLLGMMYFWYIRKLDNFKPVFSVPKFKRSLPLKEIINFGLFSFLGGFGAILMNQIDIQMIAPMLGSYSTGLYSWSFFIANSLAIPLTLLASISTPLLSKFWKTNDMKELNKIYSQSSRSLLVISVGLFTCILVGIDDLFSIMPKGEEFALAKWTVIMLCISKVIDMAAGLNSQILAMSECYRYMLLFLSISVVFNVGLNALLIPIYGIEGSAVATIVSLLIFNILKYVLLRIKYRLYPKSLRAFIVVPIAALLYVAALSFPHFSSGIINILIFSGSTFVIYYLTAYKLKLAPELNEFVNKQLLRLRLKPFD